MFLSFRLFFSKCILFFLSLKIHLSHSTSPVNSVLLVAAQMYDKINVFDEVFFPPCNCCYYSWNSLFSISIVAIVQKTNSFNASGISDDPNYPWKKKSQTKKDQSRNFNTELHLLYNLSESGLTQIIATGSESRKKLLFLHFH